MNMKEWRKACNEGWAPRKYDNLCRAEQKSLKYNPGPNATVRHHLRDTEEHKKAISEGGKGRVVSKETREKISKIHKGKIVSDETRQRLREANKMVWENEDYRKYQSDIRKGKAPWNKGVPMTEGQKEKLSAAKKGKPNPFNDEHKKKIIDSINKRVAAYRAYKELHKDSDIKYNEFCKVVWPELKNESSEN